jgi:RNA polymerase sigma factor (TIGR02999 family)
VSGEVPLRAKDITGLLQRSGRGESHATSELYNLLYAELHALAASFMRRERLDHTLQPTALLNEAYLRLAGQRNAEWKNRSHFLAIASQAMRRILVDHARSHRAERHGGSLRRLTLDDVLEFRGDAANSLIEIDEALDRLKKLDARQAQIVEMHFFGSLSFQEIAGFMGISSRTVERSWRLARAWLHERLSEGPG